MSWCPAPCDSVLPAVMLARRPHPPFDAFIRRLSIAWRFSELNASVTAGPRGAIYRP